MDVDGGGADALERSFDVPAVQAAQVADSVVAEADEPVVHELVDEPAAVATPDDPRAHRRP
ncbi:MAG: hypothetical protein R2701_01165 [Acidimicrobiales bacterium]